MKIEIVPVKTQKLFEVYFIKTRIHKQSLKKRNGKNFSSINLTTVMIQFKKALQVIFKYHKHHKRIKFIGAPQSLENMINFSSPHIAVPTFLSVKQNQSSNSLKNKNPSLLSKLEQKPDLIVLFSSKLKSNFSLKESSTAKTPMIVFNDPLFDQIQKSSYLVCGNIKSESKDILNHLFFTILDATLER